VNWAVFAVPADESEADFAVDYSWVVILEESTADRAADQPKTFLISLTLIFSGMSEEVKRFPELKQLYELVSQLKRDYPDAAKEVDEWWAKAVTASYYTRSCDLIGALTAAEDFGAAKENIHNKIKEAAPKVGVLKAFVDATTVDRKSLELSIKLSEILRKLCGCKYEHPPPVEGPVEEISKRE